MEHLDLIVQVLADQLLLAGEFIGHCVLVPPFSRVSPAAGTLTNITAPLAHEWV